MSVNYNEIYCLADVIRNDNRFVNKPQNLIYGLFYKYLEHSISYFLYDCFVDLNDRIPFSQTEYVFTSDGVDNQYLLSPSPPSGCDFYVGFRENNESEYNQTFDYTFDSMTNILTINNNPPNNYEVYIGAYIIGQFNKDLNIVERDILANGMMIPWTQEQLFKNSLLSQMIYGGSSKIYSQAEHIRQVKGISNNQYFNIVKTMISDYSYKGNKDKSRGLGGGLV
jgi:hypothetical protein